MTIKEAFIKLVKDKGKVKKLRTFALCSDYECELSGSTVDSIIITDDDSIVFVYNENQWDVDDIEDLNELELWDFYNELTAALSYEDKACSRFENARNAIAEYRKFRTKNPLGGNELDTITDKLAEALLEFV